MKKSYLIALLGVCFTIAIVLFFIGGSDSGDAFKDGGNQASAARGDDSGSSEGGTAAKRSLATSSEDERLRVEARLQELFEIIDQDDRWYELELFFEDLDPKYLELVKASFEETLDDSRYKREFELFFYWWLKFAPEDVLTYGASDFDGNEWNAKHLAATEAAREWLKTAPQAAGEHIAKLPPGTIRANIMAGFGQEYAIADLDSSIAWADSSTDPDFRAASLFGVAYGALRSGMHDNFDPEITNKTAKWLETHADQPYAEKAISHWVSEVVREDSEQAADWVNWVVDLPDGETRNGAIQAFFENASYASEDALDGWLEQVEDGPALDFASAGFISNARNSPQDEKGLDFLRRLSGSIQDETLREEAMRQVSEIIPEIPEE